jgi:hypothetical protein
MKRVGCPGVILGQQRPVKVELFFDQLHLFIGGIQFDVA